MNEEELRRALEENDEIMELDHRRKQFHKNLRRKRRGDLNDYDAITQKEESPI